MKWKAIGLLTRKTYAEGRNKAELLRKLQQKYPYEIETPNEYKKIRVITQLFPEEIRIVREK